jgi:hypothetical protein
MTSPSIPVLRLAPTESREAHVSASLARLVLGLVEERGRDSRDLLAAIGASGLAFEDPALRIPASLFVRLLDAAGDRLGDDHVGLHAGQRADAVRLGMFGMLQQTGASPRQLEPVLRRFSRLLHDECAFEVRLRGASALYSYRSPEDGQRQAGELMIAAFVAIARRAWPSCQLQSVYFAHAAPSCRREHEAYFGVPIEFDAPFNGYAVSAAELDCAAPNADLGLHAALLEHAERLLETDDFVGSVRHAVARGLLLGESNAPWVASELGVSLRTLHRKLQARRSSFFTILDDERQRRAQKQLVEGRQRVADVARALGFASAGAFRKAFKRWIGLTPSEFRERALSHG